MFCVWTCSPLRIPRVARPIGIPYLMMFSPAAISRSANLCPRGISAEDSSSMTATLSKGLIRMLCMVTNPYSTVFTASRMPMPSIASSFAVT